MNIRVDKIGNWTKFSLMAKSLTKDLNQARLIALKRWGLKGEAIAKDHLSSQDLANGAFWLPLAVYTLQKKRQQGFADTTLLETSTYFQAITSFVETDTAYVGVKRNVVYRGHGGSETISDIAKINEEGMDSLNIPARPLWQPSMRETTMWHLANNSVADIFMDIVRKKYG